MSDVDRGWQGWGGVGRGWEPALREFAQRLERLLAEPVRGLPRVELRGATTSTWQGLGFGCELEPLGEPVGLVWRGDVATGLACRLLGGGEEPGGGDRGEGGAVGRECSPMEAKLLERLSGLLLGDLAGCLASCSGLPLRGVAETWRLTDETVPPGVEWCGWSLAVSGPGFRGEVQVLLPRCLVEFALDGREGGPGLRSGGDEYEVVLAELELSTADWEGLTEGDLLLLEREAGSEVEVRGPGGEVWRGEVGVCEGVRAVRILGAVDGAGVVGGGETAGPEQGQ